MTDDVETRLRGALQYNADRVQIHQTELRAGQLRGSRNRVRAGVAAAACVVGIAAAATVGRGVAHHGSGASGSPQSYTGRQWLLTAIEHGGRSVDVPDSYDATVEFFGADRIGITGVNYVTAHLQLRSGGFTTSGLGGTTGGAWASNDALGTEVQAALASIVHTDGKNGDGASFVRATLVNSELHLAANGYRMIFRTIHLVPTTSPSVATR